MFCIKCGAQNEAGKEKCVQCGEKLAQAPPGGPIPSATMVQRTQQGYSSSGYNPGFSNSPGSIAPQVSGMAIVSLVLGILGFFTAGLTGLAGLIIGIIALRQIARNRPRLSGDGMAIGGIITSGVSLLFVPITAAILLPVFAVARERARSTSCMSNLKQLSTATLAYVQDFDEKFPPGRNWSDLTVPYVRNSLTYTCPDLPGERGAYTSNAPLSGLSISRIANPYNAVELFDGRGGWNAAGGVELVDPRHQGYANFSFVDGHVKRVQSAMITGLLWNPMGSGTTGPNSNSLPQRYTPQQYTSPQYLPQGYTSQQYRR